METLDQQLVDQASLRATARAKLGQRIVLKVTAFGPNPLTREAADSFSRTVHGPKRGHAEHKLTYVDGIYYLDFNNLPANLEEDCLDYAVKKTDAALLEQQLPAEIVDAWDVPQGSPEVSHLLDTKQLDGQERLRSSALAISESYRTEFMGSVAAGLLFTT